MSEYVSSHHQHLDGRSRPDAEIDRFPAEQGILTKERLRTEDVDHFVVTGISRGTHNFHFAAFDDIETGGCFALPNDQVARLVMRVRDAVRLARAQMGEVAREHELPRPIESDLDASRPRRELEEIN